MRIRKAVKAAAFVLLANAAGFGLTSVRPVRANPTCHNQWYTYSCGTGTCKECSSGNHCTEADCCCPAEE